MGSPLRVGTRHVVSSCYLCAALQLINSLPNTYYWFQLNWIYAACIFICNKKCNKLLYTIQYNTIQYNHTEHLYSASSIQYNAIILLLYLQIVPMRGVIKWSN